MSGRKDKKKKSNPVFAIIIIICLAIAAYAAYNLITIWMEYKTGQDEYDGLKRYTSSTIETSAAKAEATESADESTTEVQQQEKPPVWVDFEALKSINPDIAGWLYLGAEDISYPVVHYTDNDYYLHRTFERTDNFAGSLFIDFQNKADLTDPNTLIYGHNMKDRSMFGRLKLLYENNDYQKDDTFWVITEKTAYKYKIFSMQRTTDSSDIYTLFSAASPEVKDYITRCSEGSLVSLPIEGYDENSRVVTLSTCQAATGSERFVVQGILVNEVPTE